MTQSDRTRAVADSARDLARAAAELLFAALDLDAADVADARGRTELSPSLKSLADRIDAALWTFDLVQTSAGLKHPRTTRHGRFLSGR
jgi:hypothetical protein